MSWQLLYQSSRVQRDTLEHQGSGVVPLYSLARPGISERYQDKSERLKNIGPTEMMNHSHMWRSVIDWHTVKNVGESKPIREQEIIKKLVCTKFSGTRKSRPHHELTLQSNSREFSSTP